MAHPRVYADFQNLDDENRLRLTCAGTRRDLERQEIKLRLGMVLTFYADDANDDGQPDELRTDGVVQYNESAGCWVALIDWQAITHSSDWSPEMSSPVVINIAVANCPADVDVQEVFRFIESASGDFQTYELAPPEPGWRMKAAFDFVLLLNAGGSAASVAALLWMAYEKFIAPKNNQRQSGAGINVGIRKPDGSAIEYRIDNLHDDREVLIQDFAATVSEVQKTPGAKKASAEAEIELKHSGMWVRRK